MFDFNLDSELYGYKVRDLIAVAEVMKKHNIEPRELVTHIDLYRLGFEDGQKIKVKEVNDTVDSIVNSFSMKWSVGDWGAGFRGGKVPGNE